MTELRVRYGETDQMGVVYHPNYLVWCEIGRTEFMRAQGVSYRDLERSGVALVVSEARVRYHAGAAYDDLIRVETTLSDVRSRSLVFEYLVANAETGARVVTARTALVALDARWRPMVLPFDFRARLQALG